MPKRSRKGFGKKRADERLPSRSHPKEHPNVSGKRKRKPVAESPVERRRSVRCRRQSLRRNNKSEKISSNYFDCYLENIWKELPENKKNSFAYIDSPWFNLSNTNKHFNPKLLSWIKKTGIFSKKYVFVPIVLWDHWCVLICCHFGESLESESRTPCMLLLDSLHMADPLRYEPPIRKFVLDIFKNEGRAESEQLIRKIPLFVPKVPQQRNDTDCGKYALYYISLFLESAPENVSICEGYPYFMKKDWFSPEQLEGFWQEVEKKCYQELTLSSHSGSEGDTYIDSEGVINL